MLPSLERATADAITQPLLAVQLQPKQWARASGREDRQRTATAGAACAARDEPQRAPKSVATNCRSRSIRGFGAQLAREEDHSLDDRIGFGIRLHGSAPTWNFDT